MDDDMFSMLNKTKKSKKSKTAAVPAPAAQAASSSSSKAVGKRRARSASEDSDCIVVAAPEDKPSERKKVKTEAAAEVDPMEALEKGAGVASAGDETMEDLDQKSVGDISMDVEVPTESSKPMPVVTDDFEQEAEREVAATSGFAKVEEGEKMKLVHAVRHQVALPPDYPYVPISTHVPNDPPARSYKFTLDPFQRVAVNSIERNESVLVSAHTSAGKTVVAEYAIATCLNEKKRVVYTSPIKALSNQKYREMQAEFGDVGLMTGDVTINPGASCLVMTTEILRSMLYRGSEVMREVAWVVFDEIHYMRDKDRGVVWEETIILLPHSVRYVFLSATIPNSMQFAEWIAKLHNQPCHVVYTDFRPTPLQHYMFPEGGDGMYLVVDEKSTFREDNFQKAMGSLAARSGEDPANPSGGKGRQGKTRKGKPQGEASDIYKLVKMIMLKNLNPVIVFAFSKRECESLAMQMSKINMNKEEESLSVENIFNNALGGLNDEDKQLPQIGHILPLLRRGIGVHHGGLLPLLKEVIEILFQEGLIKVLFATETFSIGLNMPAKTVVFTSVQKFDGKEFRHLSGGEYIQMSGRAGRRGLDARGIVIMMCEQKLEPEAAKGMVKGQADRLDSAFHLGYNMILNLMRVEGVSPEYMLERCFYQFQNTANIPVLEDQLRDLGKKEKAFKIERREEIEEYHEIRDSLSKQRGDFQAVITEPSYALPFLQSGRVVRVVDGKRDFSWGIVLQTERRHWPMVRGAPSKPADAKASEEHIVFVLLNCAMNARVDSRDKTGGAIHTIEPAGDGPGEPVVVPVLLSYIESFSVIRTHLGRDLRTLQARQEAYARIKMLLSQRGGKVPVLDPVANMGIKDEGFKKLIKRIGSYEQKLQALDIAKSPDLERLYNEYSDYVDLKNTIRATKRKITQVQNVLQLEELKNRQRVLRRLGFTSADDVLSEKARVACEISTGDELLLTEMIFSGAFNELTPAQCAAVLVCFVFDEKSETKPKLPNEVQAAFRTLREQAKTIAQISVESRLPIVPDEYVNSFKPELSEAVFRWCNGASFAELCKMCDVFEGSLIRCFRRLGELLRQMAAAARVIGNDSLEKTFEESLKMLERTNSIIFSPSLYL